MNILNLVNDMFVIKPYQLFQSRERYIRDVLYQLNKYCSGSVTVIVCSAHNNQMTERQVPLTQMPFVLHYQLYKRYYETIYVEGFCLNATGEEVQTRLKEYLENKQ